MKGPELDGRPCRPNLVITQDVRVIQDTLGSVHPRRGLTRWGGSIEIFDRQAGLAIGDTLPYRGPLVDQREPPELGGVPVEGIVMVRQITPLRDGRGLHLDVDGIEVPRATPSPYRPGERLIRAALSEMEYGGDPVPDLFSALGELLAESPLGQQVELLSLYYGMAKLRGVAGPENY